VPGERVYSVYADVCAADSIVLSTFLVRSFEDHTEYWFAGVASPEFVEAIAPVQESELRAALLPVAQSLQLNLEGLEVESPPYGSCDGPQQLSDCARLARRIGICGDSFKARAQLAQSGLIEQLELLGEQHEAQITACEQGYSLALQQCGQGRDAAVRQAEVGFAIAKSAAECARRLGYDAAKSALNTGLALAAAGEVTCIAAAHAALYACLASLGWTGAGIPACIAGFLAAQVICHAGLVAAVLIIENGYRDAIALADAAYNQQIETAGQSRDSAILAADHAYADCLDAARRQRSACVDSADGEFRLAACIALQSANQAFREAVIQYRECVQLAREEYADGCPDAWDQGATPELDFLEGRRVEGCGFEWPPRLP
jgi:hypothetical protein